MFASASSSAIGITASTSSPAVGSSVSSASARPVEPTSSMSSTPSRSVALISVGPPTSTVPPPPAMRTVPPVDSTALATTSSVVSTSSAVVSIASVAATARAGLGAADRFAFDGTGFVAAGFFGVAFFGVAFAVSVAGADGFFVADVFADDFFADDFFTAEAFAAGCFAVDFLIDALPVIGFFVDDFVAVAFDAVVFPPRAAAARLGGCLAVDFFTEVFFTGDFLAVAAFATDFVAAVGFFTGVFFVAVFTAGVFAVFAAGRFAGVGFFLLIGRSVSGDTRACRQHPVPPATTPIVTRTRAAPRYDVAPASARRPSRRCCAGRPARVAQPTRSSQPARRVGHATPNRPCGTCESVDTPARRLRMSSSRRTARGGVGRAFPIAKDEARVDASSRHRIADDTTLIASRPKRRFTLAEARRTLPLVGRIAADIRRTHADARGVHDRLSARPGRELRLELEADLDRAVHRLRGYVDELSDLGVEIKDYGQGLLDFLARHQGRDVYLCWRLGEATIAHWHELDAGANARKSVDLLAE